ncbi:interleukin-13 receptor subunit alpha-1-like isoform 2-T2 [Polymixia lowei]
MGSTGFWWTVESQNVNRSCGSQTPSKPVSQTIDPPVQLVRNFTCAFYIADAMNCYWIPAKQIPDLQLFYGLCEDPVLLPCEDIYSNGMKKGCHLKVNTTNVTTEVCILVNGTLNGRHVRNTFKRQPSKNVKTPAPMLHITEQQDNLMLNWTQAHMEREFHGCWRYIVNYTRCGYIMPEEGGLSQNWFRIVPYKKSCQYMVQVRGVFSDYCGIGGSDISAVVVYGANKGPDLELIILIPAILSACVILACYCFRRHRAMICPDIPDPSVLFKEMMNSNKEPMNMGNLYIPVQEDVESCKIIPVMENGPSVKLLTHEKL